MAPSVSCLCLFHDCKPAKAIFEFSCIRVLFITGKKSLHTFLDLYSLDKFRFHSIRHERFNGATFQWGDVDKVIIRYHLLPSHGVSSDHYVHPCTF